MMVLTHNTMQNEVGTSYVYYIMSGTELNRHAHMQRALAASMEVASMIP
jgi:threonine/homoserine efflux transporter RhtA